jgi:hypothetical protein
MPSRDWGVIEKDETEDERISELQQLPIICSST